MFSRGIETERWLEIRELQKYENCKKKQSIPHLPIINPLPSTPLKKHLWRSVEKQLWRNVIFSKVAGQ